MGFSSLFRRKSTAVVVRQGGDGEELTGLHRVLTVRDLTFFGIGYFCSNI